MDDRAQPEVLTGETAADETARPEKSADKKSAEDTSVAQESAREAGTEDKTDVSGKLRDVLHHHRDGQKSQQLPRPTESGREFLMLQVKIADRVIIVVGRAIYPGTVPLEPRQRLTTKATRFATSGRRIGRSR